MLSEIFIILTKLAKEKNLRIFGKEREGFGRMWDRFIYSWNKALEERTGRPTNLGTGIPLNNGGTDIRYCRIDWRGVGERGGGIYDT